MTIVREFVEHVHYQVCIVIHLTKGYTYIHMV